MRNLSTAEGSRIIDALEALPEQIEVVLKLSDQIKAIAKKYVDVDGMLFFGRQFNFPIALEGALKMKEITYLFAEGHPSAELKHGIIALVGPDLPSIFIAPYDAVFSKNLNNIEQVKARKGPIIALTSGNGAKQLQGIANEIVLLDRKSTRLNSSHLGISYAVFCLKKKKKKKITKYHKRELHRQQSNKQDRIRE